MFLLGSWIFFKYTIAPVRKTPENGLCLEIYPIYLKNSETRINLLRKEPHGKMSLERWRLVKNQTGLSRHYCYFCNSLVDSRIWGCNQNVFLFTFFNKNLLHLSFTTLFRKDGFFDYPFKLTISYCPSKTTFSLSFNADLAELGPNLEKFYYTYYILYLY